MRAITTMNETKEKKELKQQTNKINKSSIGEE